MTLQEAKSTETPYSLVEPAPHSLHECTDAREFLCAFESLTGMCAAAVANEFILPTSQRAIFLVGSLPLGMATSASDVDFIVLVNGRPDLGREQQAIESNTRQFLAFSSESNLVAGSFVKLMNGVAVEVQVVVTPAIKQIQSRLRRRGPELTESEIMTLSRLSKGWLLGQSPGYLEGLEVSVSDPALDVYCSTRHFVSALIFKRKAEKARDTGDLPLAFHLGRSSVETAYLSYFASEGYSYLGAKWVAQIGLARDAAKRLQRHPLLLDGRRLLFPSLGSTFAQTANYLRETSEFLTSMRSLIERRTLFRIAFNACPQIHPIG